MDAERSQRLRKFFQALPINEPLHRNEYFTRLTTIAESRRRHGALATIPCPAPSSESLHAQYIALDDAVCQGRITMEKATANTEIIAHEYAYISARRQAWEDAALPFATRIQRAVREWLWDGTRSRPAPMCRRSIRELELSQ